ncbi:MAG: DNA primase, partial [Cytophaga sp.]|nr:DNA primase [Cytophaga sp.]
FPDNEDPDSFSRKVGTTEFQKYLKENTKDFVSFKADLFAKEAAGDPIKKAASIKEIVTSISLIPDPVKRSVYIQETSQLLKIAEPVLLTELNKILIQERKKQDKDKSTRAQEEMPMESGPVAEVEAPVRIDAQARVQFQEKECIRLLLNYSDVKLEDEALSVFLLNELNDVQFVDANYKKIFDDFLQAAENNQHIDSKFFIENGTTEIRQIVASLITVKREVSPHWADKHKIFISKDADELDKKALSNVRYFKYRLVQLWVEENKEKLKLTSDELEIDDLLDKQIALKSAEAALAEELGIVVGKY